MSTAPGSGPRYRLGIDLGTTYTAAALSRPTDGGWGEPEIVALGSRSASVASVLHLGADGAVLVGEAAERRSLTEPDRVVRQFKRRIGDDVPLVVGDAVHTAHELAARLARWVADKVAEREGGPAETIAITHPASWGEHKRELLARALHEVGLTSTTFLPEPQAAAVAYSARERVASGGTVAVYDLGGGTFDAAVVRRAERGFELPGSPEGIEQLGGVDFDDRVFDHVRAGLGTAFDELDPEDPDVASALGRLRRECVEAKEALSADTEVSIPVMLPSMRTTVRLTRREFESMIRSSLDHTVAALARTVASAGLGPDDLQAVLLVGGSSRIPLVAQMVSEELGRPVAVDTDPKTSIAVGAVLAIAPRPAGTATPPRGVPPVADAAAAAVLTSTLARGPATPSGPSSSLLDLRAAAGRSTAPGTGPSSGRTPRSPAAGPPSGRRPATAPPSGRLPAAGPVTGPGSTRFPAVGPASGRLPVAPSGRSRPVTGTGHSSPDGAVTTLTSGGRTPPRPPMAQAASWQESPAAEPATPPRSRARLLVLAAAAVVLVAGLTTGGVVYARSASVSATVPPPVPTAVEAPAPVEPTEAVPVDDASTGTGTGAGSGSRTSGGTGGSRGSGGSSGGSSGDHRGSGSTTTTTTKRTEEPRPTDQPTPTAESGS